MKIKSLLLAVVASLILGGCLGQVNPCLKALSYRYDMEELDNLRFELNNKCDKGDTKACETFKSLSEIAQNSRMERIHQSKVCKEYLLKRTQ